MGLVGPKVDLRYEYDHLGEDANIIRQLADGSHPFASKLKGAKKPLIILGADTLKRPDGSAILSAVQSLSSGLQGSVDKNWKVLNVLHKVASQVSSIL